jgi:hypothetical protein
MHRTIGKVGTALRGRAACRRAIRRPRRPLPFLSEPHEKFRIMGHYFETDALILPYRSVVVGAG